MKVSKLLWKLGVCASKYQSVPSLALVHIVLAAALIKHKTRRRINSMMVCVLVILSTVERLRGAAVAFFINFESEPV